MINPALYSFRVFINGKWVTFFVRVKNGFRYYSVQTDQMNEALAGTEVLAEMEELGVVPVSYSSRASEVDELERMFGMESTDEDGSE